MRFDADLTACAALVERADPDRFAAAMASPPEARRVLFPLYAFNVEVSRAPWVTQEPMIAEMRLQWWRDALEEIGAGGAVRRHEVTTPLSHVLDSDGADLLDRLVVARRHDIYKEAFADEAAFSDYLTDTAGGLMYAAARALAGQQGLSATAEDAVLRLGRSAGLARYLKAVPALETSGRLPLVDGRMEAVAKLAGEALADAERKPARRAVPAVCRPALTEAFTAQDILRQAARTPARVADGSLSVSPLLRSVRLWQWS